MPFPSGAAERSNLCANVAGASRITTGPDGALCFANYAYFNSSIGRLTTSGTFSFYADAHTARPLEIVTGSDGAMWFTNQGQFTGTGYIDVSIGRITTAGSLSYYSDPNLTAGGLFPGGIAAGPDGALWVANGLSIARLTTAGSFTFYTDPHIHINSAQGIAPGPDGALWFTNYDIFNSFVGRITTAGTITYYADAGSNSPWGMVTGPDGAMWFGNNGADSMGRLATAVTPQITKFAPPTRKAGATVTITGQNLAGATQVAFNGTPSTIVSDTATKIVTGVPGGATTGPITVTTPAGTATSASPFTVT